MLKTEMRNPKTTHIDTMETIDMLKAIQEENLYAVQAVGEQLPAIAQAIEAVVGAMKTGGRLIYLGAGTSGRLGVLDAAECPPTFGVSSDTVVGIMAGGEKAITHASENKEDSPQDGVNDLKKIHLTNLDVLVGISAAGNAAYVIEAIHYAKGLECTTIGLTSNKGSLLDINADISIVTDTGAEVITGSTRMKAGTAQKLVLNMLSTCAMIHMGNVYENLMINLRPTNQKLTQRMIRIVKEILNIEEDDAKNRLIQVDWHIRKAIEIYKGA